MKKRKKTNFYKILMYAILIMVAVGFTIPGFLDWDEEQQTPQLRICQSDADCYLMCNEQPLAVLCHQNICQQNSCQEESLFPYRASPLLTTQLEISINGRKLNLKEQFEKLNLNNFFIQFQEDSFTAFTSNLTLSQVLDKLRIKLDAQCLTIEQENHCQNKKHQLNIFINDESSYSYEDYKIKNNDQIKITYS